MAAEPQNQEEHHENPIVASFLNFVTSIKLPFPLPSHQKKNNTAKKPESSDVSSSSSVQAEPIIIKPSAAREGEEAAIAAYNSRPSVTFPKPGESFAPVKLEAVSEDADRTTNPLVLWQVYAIGGFFVMKWAWARWNERKGQKKSDDEPPPAEE